MLCEKRIRAFTFNRCENITLEGLTIDYLTPMHTQGVIVAKNQEKNSIDIRIHDGYPVDTRTVRIDLIDPVTLVRRENLPVYNDHGVVEIIDEHHIRLTEDRICSLAKDEDIIVLTGIWDGAGHGAVMHDCAGVMIKNVTFHGAPGFGIIDTGSVRRNYLCNLRFIPGLPPLGGTEFPLSTSIWDGICNSRSREGLVVENCEITAARDDNFSNPSQDFAIAKKISNREFILAARDPLQILEKFYLLKNNADATPLIVESSEPVHPDEWKKYITEEMRAANEWKYYIQHDNAFKVRLVREADFKEGDTLFAPDIQSRGIILRRNQFHGAGRILLKGGDGLIEDNVFNAIFGITLHPEAMGSTEISNITIRRNLIKKTNLIHPFEHCVDAGGISCSGIMPDQSDMRRDVVCYRNLIIENNTFDSCNGINVNIIAADMVRIQGNTFYNPLYQEPHTGGKKFNLDTRSIIHIAHAKNVTIQGNKLLSPFGKPPFMNKLIAINEGCQNIFMIDEAIEISEF